MKKGMEFGWQPLVAKKVEQICGKACRAPNGRCSRVWALGEFGCRVAEGKVLKFERTPFLILNFP